MPCLLGTLALVERWAPCLLHPALHEMHACKAFAGMHFEKYSACGPTLHFALAHEWANIEQQLLEHISVTCTCAQAQMGKERAAFGGRSIC